ncbi:MAG: hypothetical protein IPL03_17825 [Sterolibacteriaceae bacterium]|nr:hypothetical protein [Candidatus Methylophosphatis haderslevensis]
MKALDPLRERIRDLHDSIRIEAVYVHWVRVLIRFHVPRPPATLGGAAVEVFGSRLAKIRCAKVLRWQPFRESDGDAHPACGWGGGTSARRPLPRAMPPEPSIHAVRSLMHVEIAIPRGSQGGADAPPPRRAVRW